MPVPLSLHVELGPMHGASFDSGRLKHITIGRTKANRFQIKDETISQKHMSIDWVDDAWMAQDLGSSNGTTVNGVNIGVKSPYRIFTDDLLRIGVDTRIRIALHDGSAPRGGENLPEITGKCEAPVLAADAAECDLQQVGETATTKKRQGAKRLASSKKKVSIQVAVISDSEDFAPAADALKEEVVITTKKRLGGGRRGGTRKKKLSVVSDSEELAAPETAHEVLQPSKTNVEAPELAKASKGGQRVSRRFTSSCKVKAEPEVIEELSSVPELVEASIPIPELSAPVIPVRPVLIASSSSSSAKTLRDWFKQELVRIPTILHERAEATIREMEIHAEQLKRNLEFAR